MPPLSDQELEESLAAAGNSLLQPPSSADELLSLLDRTEVSLSKVEQSPAKSMQNALSSLMKALVTEKLLKHSDSDVKVAVASCISEITRITAPEAPYDDDKMKDVFQLIVSSFENLSDISSRSHEKRATILEIVAKVRSCVIMLDLECDQMIIEMFQHFLKAIRDYHNEVIFASMETIMSLVLEESEDVSSELLSPILITLKKNNEGVLPVARKLAERVIQTTADKIRPYLAQAVKSLDASFDDFSEVVSSLCGGENSGIDGQSNECNLKDQLVAKDGTGETNSKDEGPDVVRSPELTVRDGVNEIGTEETVTDANSLKTGDSNHQLDSKEIPDTVSDDHFSQKSVKCDDKLENAEAQQVPCTDEIPDKNVCVSATEVEPVEVVKPLDEVKEIQLSPSEVPENEVVDAASPTHSVNLPNESQSKEDSSEKRKENLVTADKASVDATSDKASEGGYISVPKKRRRTGKKQADKSSDKTADKSGNKISDKLGNKASEKSGNKISEKSGNKISEKSGNKTSDKSGNKTSNKSGSKTANKTAEMGRALADKGTSNNDDGSTSNSVAKSVEQTEKLGNAIDKMEDASSTRKEAGKKSGRVKASVEKDVPKSSREDRRKSTDASSKPAKDQGIEDETPRASTKRKRTPGTEKASEAKEYGEDLVGSKVRVWWPKDKMYYEGVVASFDSAKKKHKVNYVDGDEEVLNLRKERWQFIGDKDLVSDGEQDGENLKQEASLDTKTKKKGNKSSETPVKRRKIDASPKSKSKGTATKSGGKSKQDSQVEPESKNKSSKPSTRSADDTIKTKDPPQKSKGKSQGEAAKTSVGSKDDEAEEKTPSQSKPANQKSGAKSKGKTKAPQSGKTAGGGKTAKSSSSKAKDAELEKEETPELEEAAETTGKGKTTDNAKSRESEGSKSGTKTGKKRRK